MQSIEDFKEVVSILRKNQIEIWADLGALLGFEREGHLLEWEEDIDCGTLHTKKDFLKAKDDLESKGWRMFDKYKGLAIQNGQTKIDIKYYIETKNSVYAYFVVYKHRWILKYCDFVGWFMRDYPAEYKYETSLSKEKLKLMEKISKAVPQSIKKIIININDLIYYNYGLSGFKICFPKSYILPLCVTRLDGYPFRVPSSPKKLLELTYGKNWKKPLKIISGTDRYTDGSSRYLTIRVMEQRPDLVEQERYV